MNKQKKGNFFGLQEHGTTFQREVMAGLVGFITILYIIAVNSSILSEAGIPIEGAILATILTSFVGCLIMGFWANAPILLVPGMGINALFTFTLVESMGLTWQEALGVVLVSGIVFVIIAFTRLTKILNEAIPHLLKEAITVGLGLFLMLIGLEKGQLVTKGESSIIALGDFSQTGVMVTVLTFLVAIVLFLRNVKGNFLWTILFGTVLAAIFGVLPKTGESTDLSSYSTVLGAMSFESWITLPFVVGVFSLTMVIVFENIGTIHSQVQMAEHPEKFQRAFQATGLATMFSGLFGSSPTVATAESTAAIAAGGRTGLTAITTGVLFLSSIFFIPYIKMIPDQAIAPILIIIGGVMVQNIRNMDLSDLTEAFPAIIIISMIPFTYSIADGIALGFILYPLMKVAKGRAKEVSMPLYIISGLFLINFVFHFIQ